MGLKDFYYSLEEKWYNTLDKIDEHLPIYKIVDPIDHIVPSFVLFLVVLLLLIAGGAYLLFAGTQNYSAYISVVDYKGTSITDAPVSLIFLPEGTVFSGRTDEGGRIVFEGIPANKQVRVDINSTRGNASETFTVSTDKFEQEITLKRSTGPAVGLKDTPRTVYIRTPNGLQYQQNVALTFRCENASVAVSVPSMNVTTGTFDITEPVNCIKLYAKAIASGFQENEYWINSTSYDMFLVAKEAPKTSLTVKIRDDSGLAVSGANFSLNLTGATTFTGTTSGSESTLTIAPGNYLLGVSDTTGNYGVVSQQVVVSDSMPNTVTVTVSKTVKAHIKVNVIDNATNALIPGVHVTLKNGGSTPLQEVDTNSGTVIFTLNDSGSFKIAAKKAGELLGGYYAKTIDLNNITTGDVNVTIGLDKITTANAGLTTVKVVDQDGQPVVNAKVMLKYARDDSVVELNEVQNYKTTDGNGSATLLAGKVDGSVYAYANKMPFNGKSANRTIALETENVFVVTMTRGTATIRVNVTDETGTKIDAEAQLFRIDGSEETGVLAVENGLFQKAEKAGETVFVRIRAAQFQDYLTQPQMLWPDKLYTFDVKMKKTIAAPNVTLVGVYSEAGAVVRTLAPGAKYRATFAIETDKPYDTVSLHVRSGKEILLDNEFLSIDTLESSGLPTSQRGTTYDPTKGYEYDGQNTTDGVAKWITAQWNDKFKGTRLVSVWLKVKDQVPADKELQFFYRANFDNVRDPASNAPTDFYADTYESDRYYAGEEATCDGPFCTINETLYSVADDLYTSKPYEMRQIQNYTYHFKIVNNSQTDYGTGIGKKPIALSISIPGETDPSLRITGYTIRDYTGSRGGGQTQSTGFGDITAFDRSTSIDVTLNIQGVNSGAAIIQTQLKSEGTILYSNDTDFSIVKEKDLTMTVEPTIIPALINTELLVTLTDPAGEPVTDARVVVYAKEPGFDEYQVDTTLSNRFGKATVNSGAQMVGTKIRVEATKVGFGRKSILITASDKVIGFAPSALVVELNTISQREDKVSVKFSNATKEKFVLESINIDAKFKGVIDEQAVKSNFNEIKGTEIPNDDFVEVNLLRARLTNSITQDTFIEPISLTGKIVVSFKAVGTNLIYDSIIPVTINVTSTASTDASCLVLNNAIQTKTTQLGKVTYSFELINACESSGKGLDLDSLWVSTSTSVSGIAEVALQSSTSASGGRAGLDGQKRKIIDVMKKGEKYFGTVAYSPSAQEVGKSVVTNIVFEGKFQGRTIKTLPQNLALTTNVLNLKDCIGISSDSSPVAYTSKANVTVDATKCLGQLIDVYICKNDPGCAGASGVDGKVLIGNGSTDRQFTLGNNSKTIEIHDPSLPGTYGVSVWARIAGGSSYSYIGETTVSFREPKARYFTLNKYDLSLVGDGSQDSIQLTNRILTQEVKVKANGCIWGTKGKGFSYSSALTGAALGMAVGSMVGSFVKPTSTVSGGTVTSTTYSTPGYSNSGQAWAPSQEGTYTPGTETTVTTTSPKDTSTNTNWPGIIVTVVLAVVGALLTGMDTYDCSTDFSASPVTYVDYVTYLKGGDVSVDTPNGDYNYIRTLAPDAGPLSFTMNASDLNGASIDVNWNFDNADYSDTETVGLEFTNHGLSNVMPKYGNLTINAAMHKHGAFTSEFGSSGNSLTTTASSSNYDVYCKNEYFGNYWIGATADEGACAGSAAPEDIPPQKYHIRVVSAEPGDEEGYIKKDASCFNGVLAGSTGVDAIPRVKMAWDWSSIESNSCDYGNPNYIYCDATQFNIEMTKKLGELDEFFARNPDFPCPVDKTVTEVQTQLDQLNLIKETIPTGFIGVKDINIALNSDGTADIQISVDNETGAPQTTMVSYSLRGDSQETNGEAQQSYAPGITVIPISTPIPEYDGTYFFSASVNGDYGNRRTITRAFERKPLATSCWVPKSTQALGNLPAIFYYINTTTSVQWTEAIPDVDALYKHINFGAYLIKDAYPDSFFADFKAHYQNKFLALQTPSQKKLIAQGDSGRFIFDKRYSGARDFEAGLYDVWMNIDFPEGDIKIADGNETIEASLLLVKKPAINSPFYNIPFDGLVGSEGSAGRESYGTKFANDANPLSLNSDPLLLDKPITFEKASSNALIDVAISTTNSLSRANTSVATRGALASINYVDGYAQISFTPNYATPVIVGYTLSDKTGKVAFDVQNSTRKEQTGGNLNYWTGAAKSVDFYGAKAIDVYNDSPDSSLSEGGYGFSWKDADHSGTLYLKSVFYTPNNRDYQFTATSQNTTIWSPNAQGTTIDLDGIRDMKYNDQKTGDSFLSINDLFQAVLEEKVCMTSDGSNELYWWNPKAIADTKGVLTSLSQKEVDLVGATSKK